MSRAPGDPNSEMSPPPRAAACGAKRVERSGQRAGRVGEVDEDVERLALVDRLHPAGHAFAALRARRYRVRIQAQRLADADRGKGVEGVEVPNEVERQLVCPSAAS